MDGLEDVADRGILRRAEYVAGRATVSNSKLARKLVLDMNALL